MHADKVRSLDPGLVPAGCYFKRVARTLARAAACGANADQSSSIKRSGSSRPSFTRTRKVTASLPSTMR